MKVPKLFELSGFIKDLIVDATSEQLEDESWMASAFVCITVWLGFLNQKPVKGMFVNEYKLPANYFYSEYERWQEAEDKVIFKGFDYLHCDDYSNNYEDDNENYIQIYHNSTATLTNEDSTVFQIKTLHDLAQATNGELELQNVTL